MPDKKVALQIIQFGPDTLGITYIRQWRCDQDFANSIKDIVEELMKHPAVEELDSDLEMWKQEQSDEA